MTTADALDALPTPALILGVCSLDDIALSVLTTVIGHRRDRGWRRNRDRRPAAWPAPHRRSGGILLSRNTAEVSP